MLSMVKQKPKYLICIDVCRTCGWAEIVNIRNRHDNRTTSVIDEQFCHHCHGSRQPVVHIYVPNDVLCLGGTVYANTPTVTH